MPGRRGAARDELPTTTRPAPALPSPVEPAAPAGPYARDARSRRARPRYPPSPPGRGGAPAEQMSFEDTPVDEDR